MSGSLRRRLLGAGLAAACLAVTGCSTAGGRSPGAGPATHVPRSEEWVTLKDFRHVQAVAVTDGVVYFGTTAGLERFDPVREEWLTPLTSADGLPDEAVTALAAEPGGDAWIGTRRGLVRLVAFADEVVSVFGPPPAPVDVLAFDPREGRVWARVAGLWWTGSGDAFDRAEAPPREALVSAVEASDLDPSAVPWTDPLRVRSPAAPDRLFRLTVVARDRRTDWYAGTWGDNARRWGVGTGDWEPLYFGLAGPPGGPVVRGADGYWFLPATRESRELAVRAGADLSASRVEVAAGSPAAVGVARADRRLSRWTYAFPALAPGLPAAEAASGAASGDTVWLATDAGVVEGTGGTWRAWSWRSGVRSPATAVALDGDRLWVGTDQGLALWDRGRMEVVESWMRSRPVTAIAVADDAVFVGSRDGLWVGRRDGAGAAPASVDRVGTTGRRVRALAISDTLLLAATDAGLEVFDRVAGTWRRVPVEDGRLGAAPLSLSVAASQVWIGTTRGLVRWRLDTGEWRTYGPADGLAGAPVLHVLAEADHVWASTPRGVSRFAWRSAEP